MLLFSLRLLLAPVLVGAGSLVQRRWGQAVGGRVVGLPLTSLPLLFLLVLAQGRAFAAHAAVATLAGVTAQAVLTWAYARTAGRRGPTVSLLACLAAFALTVGVLGLLAPGPVVGATLAVLVLAALLRAWPTDIPPAGADPRPAGLRGDDPQGDDPRGDDPHPEPSHRDSTVLRMVLAATFALAVTGVAGALGPGPAGLVSALPVLSVVMFTLTHRDDGAGAVRQFAHGVQRGSFSVVTALLVLALGLPTGHVALAFAASLAVSVLTQLATGRVRTAPGIDALAVGR